MEGMGQIEDLGQAAWDALLADDGIVHVDGSVDPQELGQRLIVALGIKEELRYPTSWRHPHPGPSRRLVFPWSLPSAAAVGEE